MIDKNTIDQIYQASNIVEVIKDHVELKKAGVNYKGCCPFHDEKTPSFVVSPAKQIYKCFGCGKGGNAVNFIMDLQNKSYPEALRYLADKFNITIQETKEEPKNQEEENLKEQLLHINQLANNFFRTFPELWEPQNALAVESLQNRFTKDEIIQWQLGFIPEKWNLLFNYLKKKGIKEEFLLKSNLIKESKGKLYDYYRNRIIFPILNRYGRPVGFGGRTLSSDKKEAKYLNSPDSVIYDKSRTLYGINFALNKMRQWDVCNVVEGYTDVISMHSAGLENTVAPCGTSFTVQQIELIKRITKNIVLLFDGDKAGKQAAIRNGKLALENEMNVYVAFLPDGEDPDTYCRNPKNDIIKFLKENRRDFITWQSEYLLNKAGKDPEKKNYAINHICDMLMLQSKTKREVYIEQISKEGLVKAKLLTDRIKELEREQNTGEEEKHPSIPEDINASDFEKWGFYDYKNEYYFRTKNGIERFSNFVMKPVFHIDSIYDSKRIYEMTNAHGYRVVINLDMNEMTSLQGFQRNIEAKGNFLFTGQMAHFQKLKAKLYEETRTCQEVKNLGWQKEGFWAWANGFINPETGSFSEIDEYGVINYEKQNYFIPAFSKIYIRDKSIFIDERKFRYEKKDLELEEWMELYLKVHGNNAMIGFAFYLASLFRDHIFYLNNNFPILNLYGQRGSGKNTLAYSLLSLFGKHQTEFNIHNGTKPGLAKHLEMFSNAIAFIDEYKNSLDYDKIETLKSIYNAIGRSRINMDKGMKKETTEVNQAVILAGQEMPTVDIALSTRVIFLQFMKKENLTAEQKNNFKKLEEMERDGLPHITHMFVKERAHFVENYKKQYEHVMKNLVDKTKGEEIDERLIRNMASVCSAFKTLEEKFSFTFTYQQLINYAAEVVRDHSRQIKQSDEVGIFWNLLEAMYDDDLLIDQWHFKVTHLSELSLIEGNKNWPEGKRVLFFKFNAVAKLYAEQLRKRGEKPLPQDSLRHYLKSNKYFIGISKNTRFTLKGSDKSEGGHYTEKSQITSSFCFDYDKLNINLERSLVTDHDHLNGKENKKAEETVSANEIQSDLPF